GFGENHPKVKAVHATQLVYAKQLEEQVSSIRVALEKNLGTAEATSIELRRHLEEINAKQLANKNLSANYTRAKNTYIKEKALLDGVRTRDGLKRWRALGNTLRLGRGGPGGVQAAAGGSRSFIAAPG